MSCILCFLDDNFQERLRRVSQSKADRFEHALADFQANFLNELKFLESADTCEVHKNFHVRTKTYADVFYQKIKQQTDILQFCNTLRHIYQTWIEGQGAGAMSALRTLLNEKQIIKSTPRANNLIYFRGRKSDSFLTKEELFHIPFNKRHFISNQRYSITGQPLLYLGLCPLDVVYEIRAKLSDLSSISFCSLVHTSADPLFVLDLNNPYLHDIANYEIMVSAGYNVNAPNADVESDFYKFILAQFCSFRRSRWTEHGVFAEEYVLPQLLTEILREDKYDGIMFSSTRVDTRVCYSKAKFHVNRFRENLALFTNYDKNYDLDRNLFNKFLISKPLMMDDLLEISLDDLNHINQQIASMINIPGTVFPFHVDLKEITGISTKVLFEDVFIKEEGVEKPYFEHRLGKLHLQLIYQTLLELRNKTKLA